MSAESRRASASRRCSRAGVLLLGAALVGACFGGKGGTSGLTPPPPTLNTATISVDTGPAAATGAVNHPYVTVRVCAPGSTTQCANIDHVLLDTGSWGLRLMRSTLTAGGVTLTAETDSQGNTIEECATFAGGQTWGPVAPADISMAGETAAKVPVHVLDDTSMGAAPPASCNMLGQVINQVTDWSANGILGIGVFAQDCGSACAGAATPLPVYFGCSAAGTCTAENVALAAQVTNPVTRFAADNNGVIVNIANLVNANGDASVQGELIFGLGTQSDNALPAGGLAMVGADSSGDFLTAYNGATTPVAALIDSGTDALVFDDPVLATPPCISAAWIGYYCPPGAPLTRSAVNTSATTTAAVVSGGPHTVSFAISNPDTFVAGAAAFGGLARGTGVTNFKWGMPFFFGKAVYVGFEGRSAGAFTGPYYAY